MLTQFEMGKFQRLELKAVFVGVCWLLLGFHTSRVHCDPSIVSLNKCLDFEGTVEGDLWNVPISLIMGSEEARFRLKLLNNLSCEVTTMTVTIPSEIPETLSPEEGTAINSTLSENVTLPAPDEAYVYQPIIRFTPRGMLFAEGEYFRRDEFCILGILEKEVKIRVCEINCKDEDMKTPCIPLCCSIDKVMEHNGTQGKCHPSGPKQYFPTFYDNPYTKLTPERSSQIRPHFLKSSLSCGDGSILEYFPFRRIYDVPKSKLRVLKNGKVKYLTRERRWKDVDQYCLTGLQNFGEGPYYSGSETDQILFTCWHESEFTTNEVTAPHYYIVTFFVGSVFLFFTAFVYILLWEKQNIHGWTVLSLVLSMFFMFIFLALSHLFGLIYHWQHFTESFFCISVGIIAHFFFLSTFCWLTVINFDLWWTFKSMAPVSGRSKGIKRFMMYLTFAWGVPVVVISVGITLQHIFPDPESEVIVPDYGAVDCFILHTAKGFYLYYIIGVLYGINFVFVFLTIYTIYKFKEGTQAVNAARSNNSQNLSVKLFIKLFFVMGVTWCFEFVSWALSADTGVSYWLVFDIFNVFQSLGIFLIFVCKRKIMSQLEQKYPALKVVTGPLRKITMARRATRTITTTSGIDGNATRTTGFSGRKFQISSKSRAENAL